MGMLKRNIEQTAASTILTMTLSLTWGIALALVITLVARVLGV